MTKLELEIHDDVITSINKIRDINDTGIEIVIPEGSVLFENVLNLKLIKQFMDNKGLVVHFFTTDELGNNIISMTEDGTVPVGFSTGDNQEEDAALPAKIKKPNVKIAIPRLSLPKLNLKMNKLFIILPIILIIIGLLAFSFVGNQKANVRIIVNSQPLTRSITVKVNADAATSAEQKTLKGTVVTAGIEDSREVETSGEKLVGEKAEGKVKIVNKTDSEREFKKGTTLVYDSDDKEYAFTTNDEVTVPAATSEEETPGGTITITPGSAEVEVTAAEIGSTYNIKKDKSLEVQGQKKANFEALSVEDFSGGKSETVKTVTEADRKKLHEELLAELTTQSTDSLKEKVGKSQKLLEGSVKTTVVKETFSHEVEDEIDKLTGSQTIEAAGLVYLVSDLDSLLDKLVEDLVPEGFVLSDKDREVSVEVLGNSSSSVLSNTEADIQVTLKTFVVPDINQEGLRAELKGKPLSEAERVLGSIRNIKTYELNLSNNIPFMKKIPNNVANIEVTIEKE